MNERDKQEFNNMMITSGGLVCDNDSCDWEDMSIKVDDYPKWLNAPCPKCGENVLTEEDLNTHLAMLETCKKLDSMDPQKIEALGEEMLEQLRQAAKATQDPELLQQYEDLARLHNMPKNTAMEGSIHTHGRPRLKIDKVYIIAVFK